MIGPEFPQVLSAAARGDEEAFGRLWHDLQPRVLRYFAVVSPAAAEDLASETWLGVVRGIERFRGTSRRSGLGCSPSPATKRSTVAAAPPAGRREDLPSTV